MRLTETMTGISLLIATRNRAEVLRETLRALTLVDRVGINLEIIVVDNNSTDHTRRVLYDFGKALPLVILTEMASGKNYALNKALREVNLKEIVLFADDDINPSTDWFAQVLAAANRWNSTSVFGGRIDVAWPSNTPPRWARSAWVFELAFCCHHYSEIEAFYLPPACPFGANFWVRREVFREVPQFDVNIGPKPRARMMGSETSFLMALENSGYSILYCPRAIVTHRIAAADCSLHSLRRRAYRQGRGQVKLLGIHRAELYARNKAIWLFICSAEAPYFLMKLAMGLITITPAARAERTASAIIRLGILRQSAAEILTQLRAKFAYYSSPTQPTATERTVNNAATRVDKDL